MSSLRTPLVVVPTYNEADNLTQVVGAITSYLPSAHILIIDDNSPDGTGRIADTLATTSGQVRVMHRERKSGLGTAYVEGFRYALANDYGCVFEMDADFSHDPAYLPAMLDVLQDCDLVIGSRYVLGGATPDWSLIRRIISNSGNIFARTLLHLPVKDCTAGFKCYRTEALATFDLDAVRLEGYAFQIETVFQAYSHGCRIREVPITFIDRRLGHSKMSRQIVAEAFVYVAKRWWSARSRVAESSQRTRPASQ